MGLTQIIVSINLTLRNKVIAEGLFSDQENFSKFLVHRWTDFLFKTHSKETAIPHDDLYLATLVEMSRK